MRTLGIIVVIVLAFIIFAFWSQHMLQESADKLSDSLNQLIQSVNDADWNSATQNKRALEEKWDDTRKLWEYIIDHREMDQIEKALARMDQLLLQHETTFALAELVELNMLIRHIPRKEILTFKSIF